MIQVVRRCEERPRGVLRVRVVSEGVPADLVVVAIDRAAQVWCAAGDVLVCPPARDAGTAFVATAGAHAAWPGARLAVSRHPGGIVLSEIEPAMPCSVDAGSFGRVRGIAFRGVGIAHPGVELLCLGEEVAALFAVTVFELDLAESGEDLGGVIRGLQCGNHFEGV